MRKAHFACCRFNPRNRVPLSFRNHSEALMTKLAVLLMTCLLLSTSSTTNARNQDRVKREAKLSPVRLLPGYKIRWASGIDSWGGKIWNEAGVNIEFDQGLHVGVSADEVNKDDVVWRAEQLISGQQVMCVYTKSNHVIISIPKLIVNFEADIRNQRDLAEMLLMALTWDMTHGYPAASGAIEIAPKTTQ